MKPDKPDWFASAQDAVRRAAMGPRAEHKGRVEEIGDGVAMISGLRNVSLDEVLRFERGQFGFARVLDPDLIGWLTTETVRLFGADRCLWGSNFPIEKIWTDYTALVEAHRTAAGGLSAAEQDAIFTKTAARVYRLN